MKNKNRDKEQKIEKEKDKERAKKKQKDKEKEKEKEGVEDGCGGPSVTHTGRCSHQCRLVKLVILGLKEKNILKMIADKVSTNVWKLVAG